MSQILQQYYLYEILKSQKKVKNSLLINHHQQPPTLQQIQNLASHKYFHILNFFDEQLIIGKIEIKCRSQANKKFQQIKCILHVYKNDRDAQHLFPFFFLIVQKPFNLRAFGLGLRAVTQRPNHCDNTLVEYLHSNVCLLPSDYSIFFYTMIILYTVF